MRNLNTFLADYGVSHRNPVNQWVHILCVPAIFVSTLGLFWLIPLGHWLGLDGSLAYWVNGGTLLAAICMPFYLRMSVGMTALMGVWLALSLAAVVAVDRSALSLGWSAAALWLLAWAVQVWGHKVEGKKPSFVDDLVFLLVGPMFVSIELAHKLGLRRSGVVN
ncbi:Mpo1-like protein [Alcanivorax sp.]|uniref:Mpo1 family 2-hydroxy fatty acid dioxygenase n=1 Tax=Alcanivorax sp. TaxID=1872427 RepID=UPI0032D9AA5D